MLYISFLLSCFSYKTQILLCPYYKKKKKKSTFKLVI